MNNSTNNPFTAQQIAMINSIDFGAKLPAEVAQASFKAGEYLGVECDAYVQYLTDVTVGEYIGRLVAMGFQSAQHIISAQMAEMGAIDLEVEIGDDLTQVTTVDAEYFMVMAKKYGDCPVVSTSLAALADQLDPSKWCYDMDAMHQIIADGDITKENLARIFDATCKDQMGSSCELGKVMAAIMEAV